MLSLGALLCEVTLSAMEWTFSPTVMNLGSSSSRPSQIRTSPSLPLVTMYLRSSQSNHRTAMSWREVWPPNANTQFSGGPWKESTKWQKVTNLKAVDLCDITKHHFLFLHARNEEKKHSNDGLAEWQFKCLVCFALLLHVPPIEDKLVQGDKSMFQFTFKQLNDAASSS